MGIKNAEDIIDSVAESLKNFDKYAETNKITHPWRSIIRKTISNTLIAYGYDAKKPDENSSFIDSFGRTVDDFAIAVNSIGFYEISAVIDGTRRRRFIRPNMPEYETIV